MTPLMRSASSGKDVQSADQPSAAMRIASVGHPTLPNCRHACTKARVSALTAGAFAWISDGDWVEDTVVDSGDVAAVQMDMQAFRSTIAHRAP